MNKIFYSSLFALLLAAAGCKEKYESPVKSPQTGYLVIEGSINSGQGESTLKLTRTTPLSNRNIQYELGADVRIEGNDNTSYLLSETAAGNYSATNLGLNAGTQYKLHIKTSTGREYLSDFASVINNPPIDSISWKEENNGVQLYINTHDPQNNTRYYQWEYTETWEFRSAFPSILKYNTVHGASGDIYSVVKKDSLELSPSHEIFQCWQYNSSSSLLLGSTAKLSKDVIFLPVCFIPPASQKLSVLYSIIVKQHTWSKTGYEFLERVKKNTEETGSVFDAQPSETTGNIHCLSDPTEPVIGFFNISSLQEKRIFIDRNDISFWNYTTGCQQFEIENISDSIARKALGLLPTVAATLGPFQNIITFYAAEPVCVDCTLTGSNVKPAFWP